MAYQPIPIGSTLKKIRENKGYTQKQISDEKMARSTYTKFENDTISLTLPKYLAVIDHMDISHEEFMYILHDYHLGEKEYILHLFKKLEKRPTPALLDEIIEKGEALVQDRYDQLVLDILNACRGYKALLEEHDLEKAKGYAEKVWERMATLDNWYLAELHVINSILYLFNSETAVAFTDRAVKILSKYKDFDEAVTLQHSFLLHVTNLLMMDKKYEQALVYLRLLDNSNVMLECPILWGVTLIRKEVCMTKIGDFSEPGLIHKAIQLFECLNQPDLARYAKENPETVYNLYARFPISHIKALAV